MPTIAINHHFRQAGPSLIKQEHSDSQAYSVLLGPDCFVAIPTKLEAAHRQYATFVYFEDPCVGICDQREWLWLILLHASSYCGIFLCSTFQT